MILPSKRLLQILDQDYMDIKEGLGSSVHILECMGSDNMPKWNEENIYEIAHKFKKWASSKGYDIFTYENDGKWIAEIPPPGWDTWGFDSIKSYVGISEPEVIILSCEWIANYEGIK